MTQRAATGHLFDVLEWTWPAASIRRVGPWTIREAQGGGKRVGAATAEAPVNANDLATAEAAMTALGQDPLVMVRSDEAALDALLADAGYAVIDPVVLYSIATADLTDPPLPRMRAFSIWPPMAIQRDIWAEAGIGPGRLAVMDRAKGPKTAILARQTDQPAGTAFVACHRNAAMIHAIEVVPAYRRQGVGTNMMRLAAGWAQDQGATDLLLAVTRANSGANSMYSSLGMRVVGQYHYRHKEAPRAQ